MTDFLAVRRREINNRLTELKPLVDEYAQLDAAAKALASIDRPPAATPVMRGPGRPSSSANRSAPGTKPSVRPQAATTPTSTVKGKSTGRARPGRRKGSGDRAAQALSHITGQPGITILELAAKMGIKQNYLYRVLPALEQEKKIKKDGRNWYPTA